MVNKHVHVYPTLVRGKIDRFYYRNRETIWCFGGAASLAALIGAIDSDRTYYEHYIDLEHQNKQRLIDDSLRHEKLQRQLRLDSIKYEKLSEQQRLEDEATRRATKVIYL